MCRYFAWCVCVQLYIQHLDPEAEMITHFVKMPFKCTNANPKMLAIINAQTLSSARQADILLQGIPASSCPTSSELLICSPEAKSVEASCAPVSPGIVAKTSMSLNNNTKDTLIHHDILISF